MSLCLNCGAENDPGLDTCIVCGSKLEDDVAEENFVPFTQPETEEPADETVEPEMPVFVPFGATEPVEPLNVEPEMPAFEPFTEPVTEPVSEPAFEPYTEPAFQPFTEPTFEPVDPVMEPVLAPDFNEGGIPLDEFIPMENITPVPPVVPDFAPAEEAPFTVPAAETDFTAPAPDFNAEFTAPDAFAIEYPQPDAFVPPVVPVPPVPPAVPVATVSDDGEKALSVGGFLFTFIMCIIPVVNIIALISWACGASKNKNRVNFSRATIIISIIVIAALVALFATDIFKIDYIIDWINGLLGQNLL